MNKLTCAMAGILVSVPLTAASALPISRVLLDETESQVQVQQARVVCDRYGRCYNTRRVYRETPRYYGQRYYYNEPYYAAPAYAYGYPYGYYAGPRVGIGIGPFGFGVW